MNIGVPKETAANERRVALTPDVAGRLVKAGFSVLVERGAGEAASFGDDAFGAAAATLVATAAEVFGQSDIVLKVQPPSAQEVRLSREGGALVALFQPSAERETVSQLAARRVTAFSLALLPRITRAQPMDVLSSQATVAGYKAVLLAAAAPWSRLSTSARWRRSRWRAWARSFSRCRSVSRRRRRVATPSSCPR